MTTPNLMNQSQLAEALGISKGQCSKLVERGMPADSVEAARKWRAENLHPSWSADARGSAGGDSGNADYWASRARREAAEAERAEIALGKEKGELIEASRAHRAVFAAHRMLRDQLLAVPNRLAAQVVTLQPAAAAELMRAEIRRCLEDFARLSDEALSRLTEEVR